MKHLGIACLLAAVTCLPGCAAIGHHAPANGLANTDWVLFGYQKSSADADMQDVPLYRYTMHLGGDGTARFEFDCNSGTASWSAEPTEARKGLIRFSKATSTRVFCPAPSIGEALASNIETLTRYAIYDGKLTLSPAGDGVTYTWDSVD